MATTIYMTDTASDITALPSTSYEQLVAEVSVRGAGLSTGTADTSTVATTARRSAAGEFLVWYSKSLDAVTISGTVTFNLWMSENNMSANVDADCQVVRCDSTGAAISEIVRSAKGTEVPVTTRAAQNWTATPTSTSLSAGDRIRVIVFGGDTLAQASGFTFNVGWGATSAAADGDTYITFTETITEQSAATRVPYSTPYPQLLAH